MNFDLILIKLSSPTSQRLPDKNNVQLCIWYMVIESEKFACLFHVSAEVT